MSIHTEQLNMPDENLTTILNSIHSRLINLEYRVEKNGDRLADKLDDSIKDAKDHSDSQIAHVTRGIGEINDNIANIEEKRIRPLELEMAKIKGSASSLAAFVSFLVTCIGLAISYLSGRP